MDNTKKIAVITGANKGIGYGLVKELCKNYPGIIDIRRPYLVDFHIKNTERGESAVADLKKSGLVAHFHQLDITDRKSIECFANFVKENHGGIDLLINNAAIAFKVDSPESFSKQAEVTCNVNYFGLLLTCQILFPLLRLNARVVNLSSSCGHLTKIPSQELRKRFAKSDLKIDELSELINEFVKSAQNRTNVADGWGSSAYNVSKVGVSALTFIQNREYGDRIIVNCVHPGYVDTDMSSHKGIFPVERGIKAALYLALDAPDTIRGVYMWHDKTMPDWFGPSPGAY